MTLSELIARCRLALHRGWAADAASGCKASTADSVRWVLDELNVYADGIVDDLGDWLYELSEDGFDLDAQGLWLAGALQEGVVECRPRAS